MGADRQLAADSVEKRFESTVEWNLEGLRIINRPTIVDRGPI
jgi:hypothetical protein